MKRIISATFAACALVAGLIAGPGSSASPVPQFKDRAAEIEYARTHFPAVKELPEVGRSSKQSCYPAGVPGYEGTQLPCVNPGQYDTGGYWMHWGNATVYGYSHRYVWVVDETGPGSARNYIQSWVSQMNSIATGNRPYFIYYTGEQLGWAGCGGNHAQIIEVCYGGSAHGSGSTSRSITQFAWGSYGRMIWSEVWLGESIQSYGDVVVANNVVHELGHSIGYAHDQSCQSVMTYCSTFSTTPLWYGPDQNYAYTILYDWYTN